MVFVQQDIAVLGDPPSLRCHQSFAVFHQVVVGAAHWRIGYGVYESAVRAVVGNEPSEDFKSHDEIYGVAAGGGDSRSEGGGALGAGFHFIVKVAFGLF